MPSESNDLSCRKARANPAHQPNFEKPPPAMAACFCQSGCPQLPEVPFRPTGSYGLTCEMAGNSEAIVKQIYQGRVSSADTAKFFAILAMKTGKCSRSESLHGAPLPDNFTHVCTPPIDITCKPLHNDTLARLYAAQRSTRLFQA